MKLITSRHSVFTQPFLRRMLLKEGALSRIVIFSALSSLLAMLVPVLTGTFIDSIKNAKSAIGTLYALLIVLFTSLSVELIGRWYASQKAKHLKLCLQKALAEEYAAINPGRMDKFMPGELAAKFIRDAEVIASIVLDIVPMASMSIVGLACALYISFERSVSIGVMMALLAAVCAAILLRFSRRIAVTNRNNRLAMDDCMSILVEMAANFPGLKAMSAESLALSRMQSSFEQANSAGWGLDKENLKFESTVKCIMFLGEATVLSVAGLMAVNERLTVGDVIVFQMLFAQTLGSISNFFRLMPSMGTINEASASIRELLCFASKEHDWDKRKLEKFDGRVELQDVSFSYTPDGNPVLNRISFTLCENECCALIGANGSGKTTLAKLVGAFSEPKDGVVLFDGRDWREIDRESLRRKISFLFQEPMIFSGTLRENVTLGENFSDEELLNVFKVCGLSYFIQSHPEGFDYRITQNGLSGGERQRIAAARALIRKPGLLILDEPGNHMDDCGFYDLKKIIECARGHTSVLLITHDKRLAAIADKVVSMNKNERNQNERNQ